MGRLFGTDGIRGIANQEPITPEMGLKLGRAVIRFCQDKGISPSVVIGRDTRISGEMLEHAVVSGVLSAGGEAYQVGVVPTPGVAYLTRELGGGMGIVLSASHNPHEYNGVKLFSHEGFKFSEDEEALIEDLILEETALQPDKIRPGRSELRHEAVDTYVSFLMGVIPDINDLKAIKVVLDCANGATYRAAPIIFKGLGFQMEPLFCEPNGMNINLDCGSQHTKSLSQRVVETGADVGLAFDGDGDRFIAVDEKGRTLTGDQLLMIYAKMLKEKHALKNDLVVSTVMSNMGLRTALKKSGIGYIPTSVGDRYVMEAMRTQGSCLGGEDSGHIIFFDHHTTGDGILAALQLINAMLFYKKPVSELSTFMTVFPQTLINVTVQVKPDITEIPEIVRVVEMVEQRLGDEGRVLVRYSGTEPVCRVMVEGRQEQEIKDYASQIADVIRRELG